MTIKPPTELKHDSTTNRAFVRWKNTKFYFGIWGTSEATSAFAKWLSQTIVEPTVVPRPGDMKVAKCVEHYLFYAQKYYARDGKPTQEFRNVSAAMKTLLEYAGGANDYASKFGPKKLAKIQAGLAAAVDDDGNQIYARNTINARINRIRRCFRWCASQEFVPAEVVTALEMVNGLTKGRSNARETARVRPVPIEVVLKTIPFMSPTVSAMCRVQLLCGMRPQDVCRMTSSEIDRTADIWMYRPVLHKTDYLDKELVKAIPTSAQVILKPFMRKSPHEPWFSPVDSLDYWRSTERKKSTPVKRVRRERRPYTTGSYGKAIVYAIARAKKSKITIPHWSPNQLRHAIGTLLRRMDGVEAAQLFLGHSKVDTTLIYAEASEAELADIARRLVSPFDEPKTEH